MDLAAIDAIVLVGGRGVRLSSMVSDVPKPLAPVKGHPFLDILLDQLDQFGTIRKVVLAVGHRAEQIIDRYGANHSYRFEIAFSAEESPLDTGGAAQKALPLTGSAQVLILNGDSYVEFDLAKLREAHQASKATATLVVVKAETVERYGSVVIDMQTMRILQFKEKGADRGAGWINAGCYLMNRSSFDPVENVRPMSLERERLPSLVSEETAYAHLSAGKFIDIGTPESYGRATDFFQELVRVRQQR